MKRFFPLFLCSAGLLLASCVSITPPSPDAAGKLTPPKPPSTQTSLQEPRPTDQLAAPPLVTSAETPDAHQASSKLETAPPVAPTAKTSHPLKYRSLTSQGISMHILSFDASDYHLKVADQNPGQEWSSSQDAVASLGGVAAINGGFFSPDGNPLGYVRATNTPAGSWNSQSSLTSGVYQFSNGKSALLRNRAAQKTARELLQTGPFLLENYQVVNGLSTQNSALRSLILWDGENHFAIVHTSSCTLNALAKALKNLPSTLPKHTALNLDGGRSCDFYVSGKAHSSPVQRGHWLRSKVRNYLILVRN